MDHCIQNLYLSPLESADNAHDHVNHFGSKILQARTRDYHCLPLSSIQRRINKTRAYSLKSWGLRVMRLRYSVTKLAYQN